MGVLYGCFAAADDDDAVRAVVRDDDQPSGTGYDQVVIKGIDPVVELMPAEALMTGRSAPEVQSDPRHGSLIGMLGDGELVVVSLTDAFRDALATCDATSLPDVASNWSSSGGRLLLLPGRSRRSHRLPGTAVRAGRPSGHPRCPPLLLGLP